MGRIAKRNQPPNELKKPTSNDSQETIATGTTGARTTASNDDNLGAGETQWVNTRQRDKYGGITNATIREIQKAIDDEFNANVRRLMLSKQLEPRLTVKPQTRRTVRISKKWTEPAETRLPTSLKQMDPEEPLSQL